MELIPDTQQIAKYSPTSTPVLDTLRPLPERKWLRLNAGEYFFLSGAAILVLMGIPLLRRTAASMSFLGYLPSLLITLIAIPGASVLLAQLVHELGHLSSAWLAGFRRSRRSSAAPYSELETYSCHFLQVAGLLLEPRGLEHLRRRLLITFAGGPAANVLTAIIMEGVAHFSIWSPIVLFGVHVFSVISILQGVGDALPDLSRGSFSDGSRVLMLLKRDAHADRLMSIVEMQFALDHDGTPATWRETGVLAATAIDDESRDTAAACWLGYLWATERQDITTATKFLEQALAVPFPPSAELHDRLCLEAAMFQAWFRGDADKARCWVERLQGRISSLQQLRLEIAQMWAGGKLFDAWEKLGAYVTLLREQPESHGRDLVEKSAVEWKTQMESRMLTRAWRTMYSLSQESESSLQTVDAAKSH